MNIRLRPPTSPGGWWTHVQAFQCLACLGAQTRFVGMMQYDGDLKLPARFLVPPPAIHGVSGKLLADAGVTTFACSETQKFGHVRAWAYNKYS